MNAWANEDHWPCRTPFQKVFWFLISKHFPPNSLPRIFYISQTSSSTLSSCLLWRNANDLVHQPCVQTQPRRSIAGQNCFHLGHEDSATAKWLHSQFFSRYLASQESSLMDSSHVRTLLCQDSWHLNPSTQIEDSFFFFAFKGCKTFRNTLNLGCTSQIHWSFLSQRWKKVSVIPTRTALPSTCFRLL